MDEEKVKDWLRSYIYLRQEVDARLERIARMKSREQFAEHKDSDGSKHTASGNDRMAKAIIRRMMYVDSIATELEAKMDEMDAITAAVDCLEDAQEREILRLRYIDCEECRHTAWRDIAFDMYGDDDEAQLKMVFRIHKRAIENIGRMKQ